MMIENRLRLPLGSVQWLFKRFSWIVLLSCLLSAEVLGQEASRQSDPLWKELLSRLSSGDEEQRLDAIARIGALWQDAPVSTDTSIIAALSNSLQQDSSPVVRALSARVLAIRGGNQSDSDIVLALTTALGKEREGAVRKAIIYALARYSQPQARSALIPFLKDRNSELRAAAAYALAENGDAAVAQALAEVLRRRGKDEDAFARSQAARGLGRIGGRDSIDPLLEALTRDKSQEVRREAAQALGRIAERQDAKVIEALRDATQSNDPYLVIAADGAIASINSRDL
ncbi:MAG: HEAT repeat domain-containing protein [Blastocatellales bacterium]